jgi:hypothetical protein
MSVKVKYFRINFETSWLPGAVGFTEQAKSALASMMGLDKKIIRGSYAILGASRDKLIQEGAALKRLLYTIRDLYTIPEFKLIISAASPDEMVTTKRRSSYLIEATKIDEFMARFNEARTQFLAWGKKVGEPENYNRIKEADKAALGNDWAIVEGKYPSAAALVDSIGCEVPAIEPFDVKLDLEAVAPATAKQLQRDAEARLAASIEGATAELIFEFKEMVEAVARNCGKRIRLLPPINHKHANLRYAEVQSMLTHADEETIPVGSRLLTVQTAAPKDSNPDKFVLTGKPTELLVNQAEYDDLRPYETDEYKQLAQASFDNLLTLANKISSVKTMLGNSDMANNLTKLADDVATTLSTMGRSAAEISSGLKSSSYARAQAKNVFSDYLKQITAQDIEVRQKAKTSRRKIKFNGEE